MTTKLLTVEQYFQPRSNPVKGDVGVEIEVEGVRLPAPDALADRWLYTRDGSLRGESMEYVFAQPLKRDESVAAVLALKNAFTTAKAKVNDSMRAGVHFHINVRHLTMKELFTFVSCYYILEELITRSAGKSRQGNLFALRIVDAYDPINRISEFLNRPNRSLLSTDEIRYAALNLSALYKYGSVEFRQLRTPPDFSQIIPWIDLYLTLRDNSIKLFDGPLDVVRQFSGGGERQFVLDLLGDELAERFVLCHSDYADVARNGSRYVQDYAFILRNNEEWSKHFTKSPEKTKSTFENLRINLINEGFSNPVRDVPQPSWEPVEVSDQPDVEEPF